MKITVNTGAVTRAFRTDLEQASIIAGFVALGWMIGRSARRITDAVGLT